MAECKALEPWQEFIVHENPKGVPLALRRDIGRQVNELRYREAFHLSYAQFLEEPIDQINLAFFIWEQDRLRDTLKAESNKSQSP